MATDVETLRRQKREWARKRRAERPEEVKAYQQAWFKAHPGIHNVYRKNRLQKKASIVHGSDNG